MRVVYLSHCCLLMGFFLSLFSHSSAQQLLPQESFPPAPDVSQVEKNIPGALTDWVDWATWDVSASPVFFNDGKKRVRAWTTSLALTVTEQKGEFSLKVSVYEKEWVKLPGDRKLWPISVKVKGEKVPVLAKDDAPAVLLSPGVWEIKGEFTWEEIPQTILLPQSVGVLSLTRDGNQIPNPSWDSSGKLWIKRTALRQIE